MIDKTVPALAHSSVPLCLERVTESRLDVTNTICKDAYLEIETVWVTRDNIWFVRTREIKAHPRSPIATKN